MNLPPPIAAIARLLRRDVRQLKEAIDNQNRAKHDAEKAAEEQAQKTHDVVVSTSANKKFVAEIYPHDPKGYATQQSIKRAAWVAAIAACAAFVAAAIYASIAAMQLNTMRRQFQLDERAWIGLVQFETFGGKQSDDGRTFSYDYVRLAFRNTGKTPALGVSLQRLQTVAKWGFALGSAKPLPTPDFDEEVKTTENFYEETTAELIRENPKNAEQIRKDREATSPTKTLLAISPSSRSIAPTADFLFDWRATHHENAVKDSKTGEPITLYLLGKITYEDIFGSKRHTTKFCLMWYESSFVPCPSGANWMD